MRSLSFLCQLCFLVLLAANAPAQDARPPAHESAPEYGMPIRLEQAKLLAAVVREEAARAGEDDLAIAVVHPSGELIYFEKMDKAYYLATDLARKKAVMAARYRMRSGNLPPGGGATLPDAISLPGGLPIVVKGKTIGAIGISGAEANDVKFAEIAINMLNQRDE